MKWLLVHKSTTYSYYTHTIIDAPTAAAAVERYSEQFLLTGQTSRTLAEVTVYPAHLGMTFKVREHVTHAKSVEHVKD